MKPHSCMKVCSVVLLTAILSRTMALAPTLVITTAMALHAVGEVGDPYLAVLGGDVAGRVLMAAIAGVG